MPMHFQRQAIRDKLKQELGKTDGSAPTLLKLLLELMRKEVSSLYE